MHFQLTTALLGLAAMVSALPRHPGHKKVYTTVSDGSSIVICQDCATVYNTVYRTVDATVYATGTSDDIPTATSIVATTQSSAAAAKDQSALSRSVDIESTSSYSSGIVVQSSSASSSLAAVPPSPTSSQSAIPPSLAVSTSLLATSTAQRATSSSTSTSTSIATSATSSSTTTSSNIVTSAATSSTTTSSSIVTSAATSSTAPASSSSSTTRSFRIATSAAASSTAAVAAAAAGGSSLKTKRGVVTNPFPGVTAPFAQYEKISWDMNWWEGPPDAQPSNWQFIPQLTHFEPDQYWKGSDFFKNPSKYPYIASFLEPNVDSLSIDDAVKSWKTNLEPLTSSHTVLPPMIGQNGLDWLQKFITACSGCTLDKGPVAFTVYVSTDDAGVSDFKNHVTIMENAFPGRELWVANMGVLGTASDDKAEWLMRQLIPFLENRASVTRYAWNGDASFWNNSTKTLTDLAKTYATL